MQEYITWFASQEPEVQTFVEAFRQETQALASLAGPGGIDRAWLLQRLRHECSTLDIPYACLDFGDGRRWNLLSILRQTRDQMGAIHFNLLTRTLNKIGTGALPSLDEVNHLRRQDIRTAQGESVGERDDYAFVRAREKRKQQTLEARITRAFYTCLEALCQQGPIVFVCDSYEKTSAGVDRWIRSNLISWTCKGQLTRLVNLVARSDNSPRVSPLQKPIIEASRSGELASTTIFTHNISQLTEQVCLFRSSQSSNRVPDEL